MYYAVKKAPFLVRTFAPHRLFFAHSDLVGSHHATESDPASCSFIFPSHLEKGSTLSSQMQCYNNVSRHRAYFRWQEEDSKETGNEASERPSKDDWWE